MWNSTFFLFWATAWGRDKNMLYPHVKTWKETFPNPLPGIYATHGSGQLKVVSDSILTANRNKLSDL